jgi:hypothetical protein
LVGDEPRIPADAIAYRNLVAAVMEGAVYEFRAVRAQSIRRGADLAHAQQVAKDSYVGRWIFGDGPKSFGFRWCCSVLGEMNPERVRSSLIELMDFPKKYAVKVKSSAQHKDNQWHTRAE